MFSNFVCLWHTRSIGHLQFFFAALISIIFHFQFWIDHLYGFFFLISSDLFPGCMPKVSHKTLRNPVILSLTSWTIRATVCLWQKGHLNKKSCFHRKSFMYQAVVSKCRSKRMNRAGCPNATTSRDLVTCVVSSILCSQHCLTELCCWTWPVYLFSHQANNEELH